VNNVDGVKSLILKNGVYEEHINMFMSENDELIERGLVFLAKITENFSEAQEKLVSRSDVISRIVELIQNDEYTAIDIIFNMLQLKEPRSTLPSSDIEDALKHHLLMETNIDDILKDKVFVIVANLIESDQERNFSYKILIDRLQQLLVKVMKEEVPYVSIKQILLGLHNISINDTNKLLIGETEIINILVVILGLKHAHQGINVSLDHASAPPVAHITNHQYIDTEIEGVKLLVSKILWNLTFKEENRNKMISDGSLDIVKRIASQEISAEVKTNIVGILWMFGVFAEDSARNKHGAHANAQGTAASADATQRQQQQQQSQQNNNNSSSNKVNSILKNSLFNKGKGNENVSGGGGGGSGGGVGNIRVLNNNSRIFVTWTIDDVKNFLRTAGLDAYIPIFEAQNITGVALGEIADNIYDIQFLQWLDKRLEFRSFGDLMIFVRAVKSVE